MEMELNMNNKSPYTRKDCKNKQFIKPFLTTPLPKQELETNQPITKYANNTKGSSDLKVVFTNVSDIRSWSHHCNNAVPIHLPGNHPRNTQEIMNR